MDDLNVINETLVHKSPAKRIKFLRQKVIKKNQEQFCQDGIIRFSTLKYIETGRIKVSPRIAERLVHKFRLEGIICKEEIFLEPESDCQIILDDTREKIIGPSGSNLEEIRKKLSTLIPVHINKELCPAIAPNGATALARELREEDLYQLKDTLCLVHGTKTFVSLLSYENNQILSDNNGKIERFPTDIIHFCGMYAIEILYFNK